MATRAVLVGILSAAFLAAAGIGSAQEAAVSLFAYLQIAPPAVRVQASKLIAEKYPLLPDDIARLISKERPTFYQDVRPALEKLVAEKYPTLQAFVESEIQAVPEIQEALDKLITTKYAPMLQEIEALPPGDDLGQRAATLVRTKYPELARDVFRMLREQYPAFIVEVQRKVQAKYPTFMADAGTLVLGRYPELNGLIMAMVQVKYPDLRPKLMAIMLSGGLPAPEDPPPSPDPAKPVVQDERASPHPEAGEVAPPAQEAGPAPGPEAQPQPEPQPAP